MFNAGSGNWQQCGALEYFGQDETVAGIAAGKRLASAGKKNVLCVLHAQGEVQLEDRCAGVKQGLGSDGTNEGGTGAAALPWRLPARNERLSWLRLLRHRLPRYGFGARSA
jgi:simple sugar transport system substrate-binding protein